MRTRTLNGSAHDAVATRPGVQGPGDAEHEGADAATGQALPDAAELHCTLAASQQQLGAALRQIVALEKQEALLKQEVVLLAQAVAQTHQFAHHDALTGLPNRRLLLDRFNQAVAQAARQHKQVALLFLDLDEFKSVNDTLGHSAGDSILQQVAARLSACIRASDTACRFGGDEFVILLPEFEGQESAVAAAEKIRAHLETPYFVDGSAIRVTASIGMAVYPVDGHEYGNLIQASDLAMYRNKARACAAKVHEPALQTRHRPNGIDSTEERHHATTHTATNPIGDKLRSRAGRSVQ